jgi:hypothetical protein
VIEVVKDVQVIEGTSPCDLAILDDLEPGNVVTSITSTSSTTSIT